MADRNVLQELRDILVKLYPKQESAKPVADDSGLNTALIGFSSTAKNNWYAILQQASNEDKLLHVIDTALADYPNHTQLQAIHDELAPPEEEEEPTSQPEIAPNTSPDTFDTELILGTVPEESTPASPSEPDPPEPDVSTFRQLWNWAVEHKNILLTVVGILISLIGVFQGCDSIPTIENEPSPTPTEQVQVVAVSPDAPNIPTAIIDTTVTSESSPSDSCPDRMKHIDGGKDIAGFCMDIFEVTNGQHRECEQCTTPNMGRVPGYENYYQTQLENPVVFVDWDQAAKFCNVHKDNKRLPTQKEWLLAYQALEPKPLAQTITTLNSTDIVGSHDSWDKSDDDIFDLAGNVREWADDGPSDGQKYVMGDSYAATGSRESHPTTHKAPTIGFRCVK